MPRSPFADAETERIDLGDGLWWDIKRRLTYGDRMALRRGFVRVTKKGGKAVVSQQEVIDDPEQYNVQLLLLGSVAWNFVDGEGIAPINEANIKRLDEALVLPVLARMGELYQDNEGKKKP